MIRYRTALVVVLATLLVGEAALPAFARGGGAVRAQSRSSIGGGGNRGGNVNRGGNANRNENINRNTNVNQNVNVNRNVNVNNNYYGGGGYGGGCCYHPVATAAAVTATAVVTAAVVGSVVNSLPTSCSTVIVNGLAYQQCGSTWYQPQLSGSSTTYVVVNAPR
jgi:hypothetical protein